jgi:protein-S-isoprenylcysteine O-methyltransferase Ste14
MKGARFAAHSDFGPSLASSSMPFRPADLAIYAAHAAFWIVFAAAFALRRKSPALASSPESREHRAAKHSRLLVAFHFVGFAVMYTGIEFAVFHRRATDLFPGQRVVGAMVIATGAVLSASAILYFHSWRFRAEVQKGHRLATGGPFAVVRHPIYTGLDLLALGSALWLQSPLVWAGFALMAVCGDVRARSEEKLLIEVFGDDYISYKKRTWRTIPGIY